MPIPIEPDSDELPFEACCFCRRSTLYWTELANRKPGGQVACCADCAGRADPEDVPTKDIWWRREVIATGE
jgi:hypothetical protein